jgi:hypothetical protein
VVVKLLLRHALEEVPAQLLGLRPRLGPERVVAVGRELLGAMARASAEGQTRKRGTNEQHPLRRKTGHLDRRALLLLLLLPPLLLAVAARAVRRGPRAGVIHLAHHVGPRAPRKALLDVEKAHATAPRAAAAAALTALTALLATPAAPRAPDAPRLRQHARPHLRPPPRRPR